MSDHVADLHRQAMEMITKMAADYEALHKRAEAAEQKALHCERHANLAIQKFQVSERAEVAARVDGWNAGIEAAGNLESVEGYSNCVPRHRIRALALPAPPASRADADLRAIEAMFEDGQVDDDGVQVLPDFEPGMSTTAKVEACLHLLERRRDVIEASCSPVDALREAAQALGAMPEGYCFCSRDRIGDDSKVHEPECSDMRSALNEAPTSDAPPQSLPWNNGEARSARGDLYEVVRLSQSVWQVRKNGTPFTGWHTSQGDARAVAERAALSTPAPSRPDEEPRHE